MKAYQKENSTILSNEELEKLIKQSNVEHPLASDEDACEAIRPKDASPFGGLMGWICPVCGRGLSPYTDSCPCVINREITCGTGTAVPQFGTVISHNAPTANLREDADPGRWYAVGYKSKEMDGGN